MDVVARRVLSSRRLSRGADGVGHVEVGDVQGVGDLVVGVVHVVDDALAGNVEVLGDDEREEEVSGSDCGVGGLEDGGRMGRWGAECLQLWWRVVS